MELLQTRRVKRLIVDKLWKNTTTEQVRKIAEILKVPLIEIDVPQEEISLTLRWEGWNDFLKENPDIDDSVCQRIKRRMTEIEKSLQFQLDTFFIFTESWTGTPTKLTPPFLTKELAEKALGEWFKHTKRAYLQRVSYNLIDLRELLKTSTTALSEEDEMFSQLKNILLVK